MWQMPNLSADFCSYLFIDIVGASYLSGNKLLHEFGTDSCLESFMIFDCLDQIEQLYY